MKNLNHLSFIAMLTMALVLQAQNPMEVKSIPNTATSMSASNQPLDVSNLTKMDTTSFDGLGMEIIHSIRYYDDQLLPVAPDTYVASPYFTVDAVYADASGLAKAVVLREANKEEQQKRIQGYIENLNLPFSLSHPNLQGLRPAMYGEKSNMLNITEEGLIFLYGNELKPISREEFHELVMGGGDMRTQSIDYIMDHLVDDEDPSQVKEVRGIVVRPRPEAEKEGLRKAFEKMDAMMSGEAGAMGSYASSEETAKDMIANDFSVNDLDGNPYSLASLKGKVVVLNFWFVNCPPCVAEMPELNKLVAQYKDNPDVVFLAIGRDGAEKIRDFIAETPFDYTLIPNGVSMASAYEVYAYPTHVVIGKDGTVLHKQAGGSSVIVEALNHTIKEALSM